MRWAIWVWNKVVDSRTNSRIYVYDMIYFNAVVRYRKCCFLTRCRKHTHACIILFRIERLKGYLDGRVVLYAGCDKKKYNGLRKYIWRKNGILSAVSVSSESEYMIIVIKWLILEQIQEFRFMMVGWMDGVFRYCNQMSHISFFTHRRKHTHACVIFFRGPSKISPGFVTFVSHL